MVKSTTTTNAETAGPQDLPAGWMHTNSPKPKPKVTPVSSPAMDDGGADEAKANVQAGRCHNCGHTGHWAKDCTIIFSKMIADRDSACALCAFPVKGKKDMIVKLACGPTYATNGSTAPAPCRTWSRSVRSERAPRAPQLHESSRWEQHRVWLCQDPYACVLRPCMKESFNNTVPNHTLPLSCTQTPMQHLRRPARPSGEPRHMRHALRSFRIASPPSVQAWAEARALSSPASRALPHSLPPTSHLTRAETFARFATTPNLPTFCCMAGGHALRLPQPNSDLKFGLLAPPRRLRPAQP